MKDNKLPWYAQVQKIYNSQNELVLNVITRCQTCGKLTEGVWDQNIALAEFIVEAVNKQEEIDDRAKTEGFKYIEWIGKKGHDPNLGMVEPGKEFTVAAKFGAELISQGKAIGLTERSSVIKR